MVAELEQLGAPPAVIEAARSRIQPAAKDEFEVWPENWESLQFFFSVQTQWFWVGGQLAPRRTGLNYCSIESVMRIERLPFDRRKAFLADLRIIELAVMEYDCCKKP